MSKRNNDKNNWNNDRKSQSDNQNGHSINSSNRNNPDDDQIENERRVDHLINLVENRTRSERHLEEHGDIPSQENIEHVKEVQQQRQEEIDHLKNIIVNGEHSNNNQLNNTKKNYKYTEGYLDHNADHMDSDTLEMTKEKQAHRKEQIDFLD